MIISRTPFRMSFFGGGTDYPVWFREHGGAVLATTIDKYCYISCRRLPPFFEHRTRIAYSRIELVNNHQEIEHPAVRGVLKYLNLNDGLEIHHDGEFRLPARGWGPARRLPWACFTRCTHCSTSCPVKRSSRRRRHVEQDVLGEDGPVGCQDQVLAAQGSLCRVNFFQNGEIGHTPIVMRPERLAAFQDHLQLYFTGFSRIASEVAREQIDRTKQRQAELFTMLQMVEEGIAVLTGERDLAEFGTLLHEAWMLKRRLTSRITTPAIDDIYTAARGAGALGGKLLGAGGGDSCCFLQGLKTTNGSAWPCRALRGAVQI